MNYSCKGGKISSTLYLKSCGFVMEPAVTISTLIRPHESPEKIIDSVRSIFPEWVPDTVPISDVFPIKRGEVMISGRVDSIGNLISILRERRVLDTAMDAMGMEMERGVAKFRLSRQSSFVGKVSFAFQEMTFGGTIDVKIEGDDLEIWLEQQTWHNGREGVPRSTGDELAMTAEGEPNEWFDSKGRRTMKSDDSA